MPRLFASATATRFAAHWVADALAGDEALDFYAFKALVGASSEALVGAPEATRDRVALRLLQEVSSITAGSGDAAAPPSGVPRVDDARSCEDLLAQLIREVESSGNLEKDLLPPFSQDIQEIICTKKLALPEISFQLLKEVDPGIKLIAPPSQPEHNGTKRCDNDQSLCRSHERKNMVKPLFPTENAELQQEALTNLVNERDSGNLQKDPTTPYRVLQKPCTSGSRSYVPPQEGAIADVGLGAKSPEKSPVVGGNSSVESVLASDGSETPFPGSINEPFPQQDTEDHTNTIIVEPQSCRQKSPILQQCDAGESPHDGGISKQSSKDPRHEGLSRHATVTPSFGRALPTDASEPGHLPESSTVKDTTMISDPHRSKTHLSNLQPESGERVNQDRENICASIASVEKDHDHEDLTLQAASSLPSASCNDAIQGGTSETNDQPGNATDHTVVLNERNGDNSHLEVSGVNNANRALQNDGSISQNNRVYGGLTAQTAPVPQNCNVTLPEANCLSEQNTGKNGTVIPKCSPFTSIPSSVQDGDRQDAKKTSNDENVTDTSPEICVPSTVDNLQGAAAGISMIDKMVFCSKDQETIDIPEGLSLQDLCIKCGKDGQLLKCNGCLLAAHDSCFGSSVTFEETDQFYCPVCFYKKATEAYQKAKEAYCEARKNLAAFLGPAQVIRQHGEQLTGGQPRAANRDGHSNGLDMSKRKGIHQNEAYNLVHQEEELHQQTKKQKLNNSSKQVHDPDKKKQVEDREASNDDSSRERASSQKRCGTPANRDAGADKKAGITASNQSGDADEIEATSSNDSGKRSSPPWRNMRHMKGRLQETEPVVSRKSGKTTAEQDHHMPSSSTKRKYAYPLKRYSNPVAPAGRRSKLRWTEEEEAFLREAMPKFTPQGDAQIPWVHILEYGSHVFHRTRLPADLRVKWRNMKKKLAD